MPTPVPSASWHAKTYGAYDRESNEAFENAICVLNLLTDLGWTLQAMCAVYGNIEAESGYNFWRWEGDNVPSASGSHLSGYGFPQFTPARKYIESQYAWANTGFGPHFSDWQGSLYDGDSQLRFIDGHADYSTDNPYTDYHITYDEFKHGQYTPEFLAKAWLHNYERPFNQSTVVENYRASIARYWYDKLVGYTPDTPIPPEPGSGLPPTPLVPEAEAYNEQRTFKINFYLKPWYKK